MNMRICLLIFLILIVFVFSGCSNKEDDEGIDVNRVDVSQRQDFVREIYDYGNEIYESEEFESGNWNSEEEELRELIDKSRTLCSDLDKDSDKSICLTATISISFDYIIKGSDSSLCNSDPYIELIEDKVELFKKTYRDSDLTKKYYIDLCLQKFE